MDTVIFIQMYVQPLVKFSAKLEYFENVYI